MDNKWNWLEPAETPECLEWVEKENKITTDKLDNLPQIKDVQERLSGLLAEDTLQNPEYFLVHDMFRLTKSKAHKQGIFEVSKQNSDGSFGDWQKVIDVDEFARFEKKAFEFNTWDIPSRILGNRLLMLLSDGGSEGLELREVDIDTGKIVEGGFFIDHLGRLDVAWLDEDHIFINHTLHGAPTGVAGWPTNTYIWKRGTDLKDAKLVRETTTAAALTVLRAFGPPGAGAAVISHAEEHTRFTHHHIDREGNVEQILLPETITYMIPFPATDDHLVVFLTEDAVINGKKVRAGALIAGNTTSTSVVYEPEEGEVNKFVHITGLRAGNSRVYATFCKRGVERCYVFEHQNDAWVMISNKEVAPGVQAAVIVADRLSENVIYSESGLLVPTRFEFQGANGEVRNLYTQPSAFKEDDFQVEQLVAVSPDGTNVDYLLVSPKKPKFPKGKARLFMSGYGAFGFSFTTDYLNEMLCGIAMVPWLERGGSIAVAFIRGGGEGGPEWHQAAMREKRQNSYDDFIAVTEKIIADGFTAPDHIGVFGISNGGLLTTVLLTQRPDLFGAVGSDVPVCDMVRYTKMGMAVAFMGEYGDPEDPKMEKVLRAYSPYHNIRRGVKYPPTLITVSTNDVRVGPGNARKMVARLKEVGASDAFLLEDRDGGHGVSNSFKNSLINSRRMAFFIDNLM